MLYAYKALTLCEEYLPAGYRDVFLSSLEAAKSNISEYRDGRSALLAALPRMPGMVIAGAVFVMRELLRTVGESNTEYGFYKLTDKVIERNGVPGMFTGTVGFFDMLLEKRHTYEFILNERDDEGMNILFRPQGSDEAYKDVSLSSFPAELRTEIAERLHESVEIACTVNMPRIFERVKRTIMYSRSMDIPVSGIIMKTAEISIYGLLERIEKEGDKHLSASDLERLEEVLSFAHQYNIAFDDREFKARMTSYLAKEIEGITSKVESDRVSHALTLLKLLRRGGIEVELTYPQAHIYALLQEILEPSLNDIQNGYIESFIRLRNIIRLAEAIGIDMDEVKMRVLQ
jgi:hypothetical protein